MTEPSDEQLRAELFWPPGSPAMSSFIFTSESVTEGHPDKVADFIA